jgi:uncharacterized membrane protein (UPF0127 family)
MIMRTTEQIFENWRRIINVYPARLNGKNLRLHFLTRSSEHEKGFMHEPEPEEDYGKLFIYPGPMNLGFWMKEVPYDLDLVALDNEMRVMEIHRLRANDEETTFISRPCMYVVELRSGWSERNRLELGCKLELQ